MFEEAVKVKTGIEFTAKLTVVVFKQPFPANPVKEYTVVDVGLTVTVLPDKLPGFHVYVDAPDPDKTIEPPSQTEYDEEEIVKVGAIIFCDTAITDCELQPFVPVAVTVYVPGFVIVAVAELPKPPVHE